ncbi:host-nuclease inhibitor Gam family protein [Desulfovulcanus sp.]
MTLETIQKKVREYSQINNALVDLQREMENEFAKVKKQYTPVLIKRASALKKLRQEIIGLIETNKELFERPKSQSLYGITFGIRKRKGRLVIGENTIQLIKKYFRDNYDEFIQTKESIVKSALNRLDAKMLKKIGVSVIRDEEEPFVKSDFDKIEKFIDALIKEKSKRT